LSCCPRNPHGHERALKEEEEDSLQYQVGTGIGMSLETTVQAAGATLQI